MADADPQAMRERLMESMRARGRLLVAFSGGLDSSVLAALAHDGLGDNAVAVVVDSETLPARELDEARKVAFEIGVRLVIERQCALELEGLRANPPDRCYHCRKDMVGILRRTAERMGLDVIADGVLATDLEEHRPGIQASTEGGVWHPLAEAGLTKDDVRGLARHLGLTNAEKPSQACLSSRIPYGQGIDAEKLRQVEEGEELLLDMGFSQVRVRHYGDSARVEVLPEELERLSEPDTRKKVVGALKDLGFRYVTVDLDGYRSGSMDEALTEDEKAVGPLSGPAKLWGGRVPEKGDGDEGGD